MRHRLGWNRLNRDPKRRKILLRKLVTALIQHERIMTTLPRAKELRRTGDKVERALVMYLAIVEIHRTDLL